MASLIVKRATDAVVSRRPQAAQKYPAAALSSNKCATATPFVSKRCERQSRAQFSCRAASTEQKVLDARSSTDTSMGFPTSIEDFLPTSTTQVDDDGRLIVDPPRLEPLTSELSHFKLRRRGGSIGVEVRGFDIANVTEEEIAELKRLFLKYSVLVFKDQVMTPQQQIEFTSNWGKVSPHPLGARKATHSDDIPQEILFVYNAMQAGLAPVRNDYWHSDMSYMPQPVAMSLLYGREVPEGYGDTCFADCYAAYNNLSPGMKALLDGKKAVHTSKWSRPGAGGKEAFEVLQEDVLHPVFRTHPETGKKALYVGQNFTARLEDMSVEESAPILEYLVGQATKPENTYRHQWDQNDVVMWDNRCTLHYAVFNYGPEHARALHRTTAEGGRPF